MTYRDIPAGAIKIVLPAVPQPDAYSCGPSALMSVAGYFGVAPQHLDEIKAAAGTTSENGTYYGKLVEYANQLGLVAQVHTGMTCEELKKLLDEKVPVLISFQAWGDNPADYDKNLDGHFAVAVGYDADDTFYFMDPSIWGQIGCLPWSDLDQRWHENEGIEKEELSHHLGIVVRPGKHSPVYATRARVIE